MWFPHECDNEDLCKDGQRHLYPDPGAKVQLLEAGEWRLVGRDRAVVVPAGLHTVGPHIDYQGHQASIVLEDVLVWIDIEDLYPESMTIATAP